MLIFDRLGIKIYWCELPPSTPQRGTGRSLAEKIGVRKLLREAFPDLPNLTVEHRPSGEPYLAMTDDTAQPVNDGAYVAGGIGRINGNGRFIPSEMVERNSVDTGLPLVKEPSVTFPPISISHCRRSVVLAVGEPGDRVGVDAESVDRGPQMVKVARHFLHEEELPIWGNGDARSFWAWTIKEAAFKAAGIRGLSMKDIPLPAEIPAGMATPDGVITIADRLFSVVQIDSPDPEVIVMLVFESQVDEWE